MKVIDLLVKIANGEEVPKKIKYRGIVYEYYCSNYYLEGQSIIGLHSIFNDLAHSGSLNDEIEVLEKSKKIEPLNIINNKVDGKWENGSSYNYTLSAPQTVIIKKLNEAIYKLNYLLEKSDSND